MYILAVTGATSTICFGLRMTLSSQYAMLFSNTYAIFILVHNDPQSDIWPGQDSIQEPPGYQVRMVPPSHAGQDFWVLFVWLNKMFFCIQGVYIWLNRIQSKANSGRSVPNRIENIAFHSVNYESDMLKQITNKRDFTKTIAHLKSLRILRMGLSPAMIKKSKFIFTTKDLAAKM